MKGCTECVAWHAELAAMATKVLALVTSYDETTANEEAMAGAAQQFDDLLQADPAPSSVLHNKSTLSLSVFWVPLRCNLTLSSNMCGFQQSMRLPPSMAMMHRRIQRADPGKHMYHICPSYPSLTSCHITHSCFSGEQLGGG